MTFQELGLTPAIVSAVTELGFTTPTPIQEQVIPVLLQNEGDVVGLAATGTGKTAAFGLPIIAKIDLSNSNVQALVLAPTRELCVQITKDIENFGKHTPGLKTMAVYGGAGVEPQLRSLRKGAHIVVGTPGRTLDFIRRGALKVDNIKVLVLDEADEMLKMGFQEDMDAILEATPSTRQTLLFSATMPQEIVGMSKRYMTNPREISVGNKNTGSSNVEHWFYVCQVKDRYLALKRIADLHPEIYGIVFCRTRAETQEIAEKLIADGYNADALHGDLSQERRDMVMNRFRSGHLQLLIATDVAARGLDVDNLTHVIQFRLPEQLDSYIHRSGRTGRAGKKGVSIAIVGPRDVRNVRSLEKHLGKPFIQKNVPSADEIIAHQLFTYLDKVVKTEVEHNKIAPFLDAMYKKVEHMSREELIQHFISIEFNRFIEYYRHAKDLNVGAAGPSNDRFERNDRSSNRSDRGDRGGERFERSDRFERKERSDRPEAGAKKERNNGRFAADTKWSGFSINLGHKHRLNPQRLMGLINEVDSLNGAPIGRIEIKDNVSYFEIGGEGADSAPSELTGIQIGGVTIQVEATGNREFSDRRDSKPSRGPRFGAASGAGRPFTGGGKDYSRLDRKDKKKDSKSDKGDKKPKKKSVAVWGDR